MPELRLAVAALAGLLLLNACGDSNDPTINCTDDPIAVTVSARHSTPRFSWAAACPVQLLEVTYIDSTSTVVHMWLIGGSNGASNIASPVTYGESPPGADEVMAPTPLETGQAYSVHLIGTDTTHGNAGFIGLGSFVY
jgi:hypothetical protein